MRWRRNELSRIGKRTEHIAEPSPRLRGQNGPDERRTDATSDEAAAIAYATLVSVWDKECDRFWARNNLLLLLNAALLGLIGGATSSVLVRATVCAFGVYFSCYWLLLNSKGRYYTYRWRPIIEAYEAELKGTATFRRLPLPFSSVVPDHLAYRKIGPWTDMWALIVGRRPPDRDAGSLMTAIALGFVVAWLLLLVVLLFVAFSSTYD